MNEQVAPSVDDRKDATPGIVATAGWAQLFLIPCSVAAAFLVPIDLSPGQRLKTAWILWMLSAFGSTIIANFVVDFRRMIGFFVGPPRFRTRWMWLQFLAWIATLVFAVALTVVLVVFVNQPVDDAAGVAALMSVPAGIGAYVLVLGMMPIEFFSEDVLGQKVRAFLGNPSDEKLATTCWLGAAGLVFLSVFLLWVFQSAFAKQG